MINRISLSIAAVALPLIFSGVAFTQEISLSSESSLFSDVAAELPTETESSNLPAYSKTIDLVNYEGYASPTMATGVVWDGCDDGGAFDTCGCELPRRWFATYENVLVQPLQSNSTGVIVETTNGYSHVAFPWELNYSPRVQFGSEASGKSLGWRIRYWNFDQSESFVANDANGLIPIGTEATVGYLSEDGDITTGIAFIREGEFQSSIRADVIDWEFQRQVSEPLDFYAGIRYAKLAQGYHAITDQGNAHGQSEFRGIGPTMALRFSQALPYDLISLFANLRGSLLFGKKDFTAVDDVNGLQQSIGVIDLRSYADGANTLASNAEMQIGIRYAPADWLALTVAFECQTYGNVGGPNPTGVFTGPDSGLAGDGPLDDSLSFAGVTVGTELTW